MSTKLAFIGCGKMGGALVRGILASGQCKARDITVYDAVAGVAVDLANFTGAREAGSAADAAKTAGAVFLCVKPGDVPDALESLGKGLAGKLVISIAAGISLHDLQGWAPDKTRIVRVMPNTPALVGAGAAAFALGTLANQADAQLVSQLFGAVGKAIQVKEDLLDAVTGLSGSGPAYVFTMIEAMADGGVLMGLPRETALQLAAQTVFGAAKMVIESGLHPAQLRDQVASPGGTTIAGIEALEENGMRGAVIAAVRAATERSQELGE